MDARQRPCLDLSPALQVQKHRMGLQVTLQSLSSSAQLNLCSHLQEVAAELHVRLFSICVAEPEHR